MLELRPFDPAHDRALISWVRSPDELLTFGGDELTWPLDEPQLTAIRSRRDTTAWTAVLAPATTPVGHIELLATADLGRGHIARVIVDPARRRSGLGRQMVAAILDEARSRGLDFVTLNVRKRNHVAMGLYSDLGFREIHARPSDPSVLSMAIGLPTGRPGSG